MYLTERRIWSCKGDIVELKKLAVQELYVLTELFDYNNVEQMISECTHDIQNGIIDIFVLYDKDMVSGYILLWRVTSK